MVSIRNLPFLLLACGASTSAASASRDLFDDDEAYLSFDSIKKALNATYANVDVDTDEDGVVDAKGCIPSAEAISGSWPAGEDGEYIESGWTRERATCEDLDTGRTAYLEGESDLYNGPEDIQPTILRIEVASAEWDVDVRVDFGYDGLLEVSEYIKDATCTISVDGAEWLICQLCKASSGSDGSSQLGIRAGLSASDGPTAYAFANGNCVSIEQLASVP